MKLPFLDFFKKKAPTEYFLALLFRDEKIHAVVFEQINNRIQVIGEGRAQLPQTIEKATDEELLDTADKAISLAEEALPDNVQSHKTVFGVKETWVEDAHIKKDYLVRLKTISDQLDLKPIGFLVFPEAIAHLLQKEEGAPVSAILVETGKKQATVTLLRAGRITGTQEVPLEDLLPTTIESALRNYENIEIFPSRIILLNSSSENAEKELLHHKWSKSLPFLHVPQITTLSSDFDTRAILFGTATQMGLDAIDVIKKPMQKAAAFEELPKEPEIQEDREEPAHNAVADATAGGEDQGEEAEMEEVSGEDTSEYFGFVRNSDVAESVDHPHATPLPTDAIEPVTKEIPEEEKESELAGEVFGFSSSGAVLVEGAKKTLGQLKRFVPSSLSFTPLKKLFDQVPEGNAKKFILLIPIVLVLLLIGFLWSLFGVHATVTLMLNPKTISQDQTVSFTTTGQSDPSKNVIAAQVVSVNEDGKTSGSTTGTKDVGTPAKGTVTIFNSDNSPHTLSAGTTITSSNGLKFTLDKVVTVASGSSDPTNLTAGTADVSVTASDIGTDYNLPSNTKFTISGTSVLAAKNANALSGGTKKSITVVSQKDLDNLVNQLTDSLKDKAKQDLSSKVQGDEVILPDFTKITAGVTNFDKKAGDEASTVNLSGTVTYETVSYKKSDIESYTKSALSGKLPSDLQLAANGITYSVKDMTTKDGTTQVTLTMKASLIPAIDTKTLSNQIAGKSFANARDVLSQVPQFADSTFSLSPNLFFLPKSLPRISGNIHITVVSQ